MMCCQCWVTLHEQDKTGIAADAAVDAVVILLDGRAAAGPVWPGEAGTDSEPRRVAERVKDGMQSLDRAAGAAQVALEVAAAGGQQRGFLKDYAGWPSGDIKKAICSMEWQVAAYQAWIANPQSRIPNVSSYDPRQQAALEGD
jgi:hypothetical protein